MRPKRKILPLFLFTSLLFTVVAESIAQDIHFSQFHRSPANLNPALTGVFDAGFRFIGNYRNQWLSVPVPYQTVSGSFDTRFFHKVLGKKGFLGLGVFINNDVAGDADLMLTQPGANVAYIRQLNEQLYLSAGLQIKVSQRSFSPVQLSFAEQWNGDVFDPSKQDTETFAQTSSILTSVSPGVNFRYRAGNTRTRFDAGFGMFHINRPNTTFLDDNQIYLPRKGNVYSIASIEFHPRLDLKLHALLSKQNSYEEVVAGVGIRYYLMLEKREELAIEAGIASRAGDAFIPSLLIHFRNWEAGISYDINHSPWKTASIKRGGPEFFIQHIIWKVQAPREFKACPVF